MLEGVSVIICCYNSQSRIAETIRYIADQKVPNKLKWELIIVNNASTDNTTEIASQSWTSNAPNVAFHIVTEPVAGLSSARQKGIAVAQFDILIFCDDDNHLDANYVFRASQLMESHPEVGIMGGWVRPKLPISTGKWIEDFYAALAIGKQASKEGYVNWVFGAGMVLKKNVTLQLKEKNIQFLLSDRLGAKQTSGGDTELCLLIRHIGYKILYSDQLILDHKIAHERLTKLSFIKANHQNYLPMFHLFILEGLMRDRTVEYRELVYAYLKERVTRVLYFAPRMILGKHQFYSFINVYSNLLILCWMFLNFKRIKKEYVIIKQNLNYANGL